MKILIIHHSGILGGATLSCFDVIYALKKAGHTIQLALPPGENAAREKAVKENVTIIEDQILPLIFGYYNGGPNIFKALVKAYKRLPYSKAWERVLEREKPDIVILNSIVLVPMLSLIKKKQIKSVLFVRETMRNGYKDIVNKYIEKKLKQANGVAYLSSYDKNQWKISGKLKQVVIPDAVDIDYFKKNVNTDEIKKDINYNSSNFYLLYVGGMNELKGAKIIVQSLRYLKSEKVKLLFLGDLNYELSGVKGLKKFRHQRKLNLIKYINKFINTHNLSEKVIFVGMKKNMNDWYSICNVVVFPAIKAHQARPIYEAGVFKKPVIASDFSNYSEYLKSGVNGFLFNPNKPKELSKVIKKIYESNVICEELGTNNYNYTMNKHNSEKIYIQINDFIKGV